MITKLAQSDYMQTLEMPFLLYDIEEGYLEELSSAPRLSEEP